MKSRIKIDDGLEFRGGKLVGTAAEANQFIELFFAIAFNEACGKLCDIAMFPNVAR